MIEKQNIICFGFAEWDNPYRTNQHHVMERLSKANRVLFIESLGLRRPTLQKKDITRLLKRIIKWFRGVRKINDHLFVFAPMVVPFHKYSVVRKFNHWFLFKQLDKILAGYGFDKPILWSYVPNAAEFLGRWGELLSVYHCVDDFSANPLIPAEAVKEMENELLARVNVVLTTSSTLYNAKKKYNPNTYYLPNVAEFDLFNKACLTDTQLAEKMLSIPSPRLGFFGAISSYKLDFQLILHIARKHPEWSMVLIGALGEGEKEADVSLIKNERNIYLIGGVPPQALPSYLKGFNVCLLPNVINNYTRSMFPLKFFEYLSAGKPVVSTLLPALEEFNAYCYLSKDYDEFEKSIIKALHDNAVEKIESRIQLAKKYSWDVRMQEIGEILLKHLKALNNVPADMPGKARGKFLFRAMDRYIGIPLVWIIGLFSRHNMPIPSTFRSILIIKLSALGDTVLLIPAIRALRQKYPSAHITALCTDINYAVFKACPYVDEIILFDIKKAIKKPFSILRLFNRTDYDLSLDFDQWTRVSPLLAYLSSAKTRIGFKTIGQNKHYSFTHIVSHEKDKHEIDCFLDIVKMLGIHEPSRELEFHIKEENVKNAEKTLNATGIDTNKPFIIFHPETPAHGSQRQWPRQHYIDLGKMISAEGKYSILLTGTKNDMNSNRMIASGINSKNVFILPQVSITDFAAILSKCRALVCGNTGIMHLACALDVAVIAIHGPTNPSKWGPTGKRCITLKSNLPCSPCLYLGFEYGCKMRKCMESVTPLEAYNSLSKLLAFT